MEHLLKIMIAVVLNLTAASVVWAQGATPKPTSPVTEVTTPAATPIATPVRHHHRAKATASPTESTGTPGATTSPTPVGTVQAEATTVPDYELNAVVVTGTKTKLKVLD